MAFPFPFTVCTSTTKCRMRIGLPWRLWLTASDVILRRDGGSSINIVRIRSQVEPMTSSGTQIHTEADDLHAGLAPEHRGREGDPRSDCLKSVRAVLLIGW